LKAVFVDTAYWIALLNPRDDLHEAARRVSDSLRGVRLVTSEAVLVEWLNDFARRGAHLRSAAAALIEQLRLDPAVEVVPQTSATFEEALRLYAVRPDKAWSHTDCSSFSIMTRHGITEALTYDRNFEQAGFKALLRHPPS
jgi:predicted nucleic acid-binding protein